MKQRVIVVGLVNKGNDFLFIKQNKKDGAYPGMLHIPGGGLEPGEDFEDGVRRELREETGIELKNIRQANFDYDIFPSYKGEPHQLIFLQYTAEYASGEPSPSSDAKEIVWVSKEALSDANLNPASIKLLKALSLL